MQKKLTITYRHLLLFSVFCVGLVILRSVLFGRIGYVFLIWNLFLAWIPFHISVFATRVMEEHTSVRMNKNSPSASHKKPFLFVVLLLLGWLAFFPNAPYIVTDFIHLRMFHTPLSFWFHAVLFLFFSIGGMLYSVCSLQLVQKILSPMMGKTLSVVTLIIIFSLTGFGIYIGRFLRWNSWDLVFNPLGLWQDLTENFLLDGFEYPLLITLLYGLITGFSYLFFRLAARIQEKHS